MYKATLLRLKAVSAGAFQKPGALLWFFGAAFGAPFCLLVAGGSESSRLPWPFWAGLPIVLMVVVAAGFWKFAHESRRDQDISIKPR